MAAEWPDIGWPYPVPRIPTPLTPREMAPVFVDAHKAVTGSRPGSRQFLEAALSIIGLENGNGQYIIDHNWGNLAANLSTWTGPFWFHPEPTADQPFAFRSYPSHERGAAAWWREMYRNWRPALEAAARGDVRGMVAELYAGGYVVGGSQKAYADTCVALAETYREEGIFNSGMPYRSDWIGIGAGFVGVTGAALVGVFNGRRN